MSLEDIEKKLDKLLDARIGKASEWKHITIAKDATVSEALDLGGHYSYLQVIIPTIDSASLELQGSESTSGTYQDIGQDVVTTAGTGAFQDTWNLGGWQYIKIKASAAQATAPRSFKVRGITF